VALVRACVGVLERGSQADLLAAVVQALRHMGTHTTHITTHTHFP
jgi:hypothetical protein